MHGTQQGLHQHLMAAYNTLRTPIKVTEYAIRIITNNNTSIPVQFNSL
jgi:hypothetical protein